MKPNHENKAYCVFVGSPFPELITVITFHDGIVQTRITCTIDEHISYCNLLLKNGYIEYGTSHAYKEGWIA